jgi:hypothetical protein
VYAFNAQIFAEDQDIVEAQSPEDLPLGTDDEAHFAADRSSVAYRKALRENGSLELSSFDLMISSAIWGDKAVEASRTRR